MISNSCIIEQFCYLASKILLNTECISTYIKIIFVANYEVLAGTSIVAYYNVLNQNT